MTALLCKRAYGHASSRRRFLAEDLRIDRLYVLCLNELKEIIVRQGFLPRLPWQVKQPTIGVCTASTRNKRFLFRSPARIKATTLSLAYDPLYNFRKITSATHTCNKEIECSRSRFCQPFDYRNWSFQKRTDFAMFNLSVIFKFLYFYLSACFFFFLLVFNQNLFSCEKFCRKFFRFEKREARYVKSVINMRDCSFYFYTRNFLETLTTKSKQTLTKLRSQ